MASGRPARPPRPVRSRPAPGRRALPGRKASLFPRWKCRGTQTDEPEEGSQAEGLGGLRGTPWDAEAQGPGSPQAGAVGPGGGVRDLPPVPV